MNLTVNQRYLILGVVLVLMALIHFLSPILTPFVISTVLAYLADPIADRLEAKGLSRTLSVILVFVFIFSLLTVLLMVVIPLLIEQLKVIIDSLPLWERWMEQTGLPWLRQYITIDLSWFDASHWTQSVVTRWQQAGGILASLGETLTRSSLAVATVAGNLLLIPVVTFYLLRDWDTMMVKIRHLLPRNVEPVAVQLLEECDEVLGSFLKGQMMVMVVLGLIYSLGLSIIGLQFALLIGMLAGLLTIIPYMGFAVGFVAALAVAFFQFDSLTGVMAVVVVFTIGQILEGWVLTPLLVGDKIGLHPVAVIFALMAGGQLFGFVGMMIALPLAAVIMVVLRHLARNYQSSGLYHSKHLGS